MPKLSETNITIPDWQLETMQRTVANINDMFEKFSPLRHVNEMLATQMNPIILAAKNLKSMADMIDATSLKWISDIRNLPNISPLASPITPIRYIEVVPTPVAVQKTQQFPIFKPSMLGIKLLNGGSFQYKRRMFKGLSRKNAEGRLLALFVESEDRFVSDEQIRGKLHIPDNRSFSWVLRNLKNTLKDNGISCGIERRWNPDGYTFVSLKNAVFEFRISPNKINRSPKKS